MSNNETTVLRQKFDKWATTVTKQFSYKVASVAKSPTLDQSRLDVGYPWIHSNTLPSCFSPASSASPKH